MLDNAKVDHFRYYYLLYKAPLASKLCSRKRKRLLGPGMGGAIYTAGKRWVGLTGPPPKWINLRANARQPRRQKPKTRGGGRGLERWLSN